MRTVIEHRLESEARTFARWQGILSEDVSFKIRFECGQGLKRSNG